MDVISPSKSPRTAHTLRLAHLMDERQRLEIADRISQLRERSPWTQPEIAEKLDLTLRGYQKLEEKGTTKHERCEAIAAIHREWTKDNGDWAHADADWIWDGRRRGETPDVVGELNGVNGDRLGRLEGAVGELQEQVAKLLDGQAELLSEISQVRTDQAAQQPRSARGKRGRAATGK